MNATSKKARKKFGDRFTYHAETFTRIDKKMEIQCPKHGIYHQTFKSHLASIHGCPMCGDEVSANHSRYSKTEFIEKASQVHGKLYDYTKVEYVCSETPACEGRNPLPSGRGGCQRITSSSLSITESNTLNSTRSSTKAT